MTQVRLDLPYNFPEDWKIPEFMDGEMPALAMHEAERIIGVQKALVTSGINPALNLKQIKTGVAIYRIGYLFETNREVILKALQGERARRRNEK